MRKLYGMLTTVILLMTATMSVSAQTDVPSGVRIKGVIQDATTKATLPGAHISIKYGTDSLLVSSERGGKFQFNNIPQGDFALRISYVGYSPVEIGYKADGVEVDMGYIQIVQSGIDIERVSIVEQIKMMTLEGDTIVYDPRAFNVVDGDYAIDLVVKMPGIDIDEDGKITAHGKEVSWTLVDGRLMFGDNALTALENVKADNIDKVKVYDVANPDEAGADLRNSKESVQRVIDLQTKNKFKMATDAQIFGGIGADIDRDGNVPDFRYKGGGAAGIFNEKYNVMVSGYFNNTKEDMRRRGRTNVDKATSLEEMSSSNPGYGRRNSLAVGISNRNPFNRAKKWQGSASYSLMDTYDRNSRLNEQYFFPDEDGKERIRISESSTVAKYTSHNMSLNMNKSWEGGRISIMPSFQYNDGKNRSNSLTMTTYDQLAESAHKNLSNSTSDGKSASGQINLYTMTGDYEKMKEFAEQQKEVDERIFITNVNANVSWRYSENFSNGWEKDSIYTSSLSEKSYINTQDGYVKYASANLGLSDVKINSWLGFYANYTFTYNNSKTKRFVLDEHNIMDEIRTRLHTVNDITNAADVSFAYNKFPQKFRLRVGAKYSNVYRNRLEKTPLYADESKTFSSILPWFTVSNSGGKNSISDAKYFYFTYNPYTVQPSIEQMRGYIDNTNILSMTMGNPNLKESYVHSMEGGLDIGSFNSSQSIGVYANFLYYERDIVTRTTRYNSQTVLPGGIIAEPGSSLTTYENLTGRTSLNAGGNMSRPVGGNKFVFRARLNYNFDKAPSYINDVKIKNTSNQGSVNFRLTSNYSAKVEYSFMAHSSYRHDKYSGGVGTNSRGFGQVGAANLTVNFLKDFYFLTTYRFTYVNQSAVKNETYNNLNAALTYKFNKKAGELSFAMFDILNQKDSYSTGVNIDHLATSYTEQMGRYYMLSVSYRFNKTSGGNTPRGGGPRGGGPRSN